MVIFNFFFLLLLTLGFFSTLSYLSSDYGILPYCIALFISGIQ